MAKVWVEAYGCSASFADSEMISGIITNGGHTIANSPSESDLNLIVTCSVKDATEDRMIYRIKKLKAKPLVVAGCLPKADPKLVQRHSGNASLMGPNSLGKTLHLIDSALMGKKRIELEDSDETKIGIPKVRLNPVVGIVEIASGCMSECTFCQTKLAKGDLTSYRIGDIVRQVKNEIDEGCKEVWLTSTDNGCYGLDINTDLPSLVNAVSEIPKKIKIRVGMMNPMYMPRIYDKLIESYQNDKVFKFIHIPVQSGSNKVLADMKRGHTADDFARIVKRFREKIPEITISTDIIVGFPTETESDFQDTVKLIKQTKPDIVNLSRYSKRDGTEAAKLNQVSVIEVKRRSKIVFDLMNQISMENNKRWIGWKGEVLFDEITEKTIRGRNFAYKPVFIKDDVEIGQVHSKVEITGITKHCLLGTIAS